jgi:hypothetical protein
MAHRKSLPAALWLAFCAFCTGCAEDKGFVRPTDFPVALETTTRSQILQAYGQPRSQARRVLSEEGAGTGASLTAFDSARVPGTVEVLTYSHTQNGSVFIAGRPPRVKAATFGLWNDKVVSYSFISSFPDEAGRTIDEADVDSIVRGRTSRRDLEKMFGMPSSAAVYPAIRDHDQKEVGFSHVVLRATGITKLTGVTTHLEVLLDKDDVVQDYRFNTETRDYQ